MDLNILNLMPDLSKLTGVPQGTLLLLIVIGHLVGKFGARVIPDDATGAMGYLRRACAVIGVENSSRITAGATVKDAARAALTTRDIAQKVADEAGVPVADVLPKGAGL